MTEYIDKAKAIEEIEDFKGSVTRDSSAEWDSGVDEGFDYAVSVIELMAASDVAPVRHGKWTIDCIERNFSGVRPNYLFCSECHHSQYSRRHMPKYCPNCGAKMDGGEK
jgi:hypothetical protein